MVSLRILKRRKRSIENVEKVTRSMKMIATVKMRRSVNRLNAFYKYADEMRKISVEILRRAEGFSHPLLKVNEGGRDCIVVITSDKGLCGGFNLHIIRRTEDFIKKQNERKEVPYLYLAGKKGIDYFTGVRFRQTGLEVEIIAKRKEMFRTYPEYEVAYEIGNELKENFVNGKFRQVYVVYQKFISPMKQVPEIEKLLPLEVKEYEGAKRDYVDFIIEPSGEDLLTELVENVYYFSLMGYFLHSAASEHSARMNAMENASRNASDLIKRLTLEFNKARQASITKELLDIITGKEAMEA